MNAAAFPKGMEAPAKFRYGYEEIKNMRPV